MTPIYKAETVTAARETALASLVDLTGPEHRAEVERALDGFSHVIFLAHFARLLEEHKDGKRYEADLEEYLSGLDRIPNPAETCTPKEGPA